MAAVTQRISNYLSGVSKQTDSKKLPGQVRECINGFPDVTLGLTKRPGFKFIKTLTNTGGTEFDQTDLDGAKWFYINRSATRYIGCITPKAGATNGSINVWNADTGAACTVHLDAPNWAASTAYVVGDKVKNDSGKIYTCSTAGTSAGSGGPTGTGSAISDNTAKWDYTTTESAASYLTGTSKANYDVLSVLDTTIITNDTVTVTTQAAPTDFVAQSRGTLLLTGTIEQMQGYDFSVTVAGSTTAAYTASNTADFDEILDTLKSRIDNLSITGLTVTKYGTTLQLDRVVSSTRTAFTLSGKGGDDTERLVVYQDWANNESWLPPNAFHNQLVHIIKNPTHTADDYYAKFVATNPSTGGEGYWKEAIGPNMSPGLTDTTMPYRLRNTGATTFVFETIPWGGRKAGDDTTNNHPSFVGQTIKKAFFHDDRLGFLSEDNVILSRSKEPFEFYAESARTQTMGDPIDKDCASVRATKLYAILPARQGLTLFSKNQQFLMYADDGPLTPQSTKIRPISNMEMSDEVDPIDVGTHFNFISKTPNFTRVFAMQTKGLGESPQILDIGRIVNEWITSDVDTLIASIQNEFIAMSSQSSNTIYFYKTYTDGKELLMESWFKWVLPGTVQSMSIDQDDMYCVTKQGTGASARYTLEKANLTQSPEVSIITNAQGQKINPCIDLYAQASSVVYDSTNNFSKCYIPFVNLTDQKNVMIVAGTTAAGTFNNSGFTITPEAVTDGSGTYFKVPGEDLSTNASNVYVGYAYDFDVELPKIYYDLSGEGKQTDFTANLTVARCKFDVGLSGVVGFKLNAVGRFASKKEFTGDGSTTQFEWISSDLEYVDRDEVKVKVNNVTTAFTFVNDTKIQFSSAPANNAKIVVYLDEWYNLNPITEANTYLADDVPLEESRVLTVPIHQRSKNFTLRVFNDSPFPVSLNSMMWEGNYSPRFYRRT